MKCNPILLSGAFRIIMRFWWASFFQVWLRKLILYSYSQKLIWHFLGLLVLWTTSSLLCHMMNFSLQYQSYYFSPLPPLCRNWVHLLIELSFYTLSFCLQFIKIFFCHRIIEITTKFTSRLAGTDSTSHRWKHTLLIFFSSFASPWQLSLNSVKMLLWVRLEIVIIILIWCEDKVLLTLDKKHDLCFEKSLKSQQNLLSR